jgi:hypothetical protein
MPTLESIVGGVLLFMLLSPLLILFLTLFVLAPLAHLVGPAPSVGRTSFRCPFSGREVSVAFVTAGGEDHPGDVLSCSAFPGGRATCKKACLALSHVGWTPSPMVARYALLADGAAPR